MQIEIQLLNHIQFEFSRHKWERNRPSIIAEVDLVSNFESEKLFEFQVKGITRVVIVIFLARV